MGKITGGFPESYDLCMYIYIHIHDIYDSIIFYICHDVHVFSVIYCPVILHCGIFVWRNAN